MVNEKESRINVSLEKGMVTDATATVQPEGASRYIQNGVYWGDDYFGNIISNAPGTDVSGTLPEGFVLRGRLYIAERRYFVVFLYNSEKNISEIGIFRPEKKSYGRLFNDKDSEEKICFGDEEWIKILYKVIEPCAQIHIYWSNKAEYKRLNIDDPQCTKTVKDLKLIKTACIPVPKIYKSDTGGTDTVSGSYQFAFQLVDEDNNTTNISDPTEHISLESENNIAGEFSGESIYIQIDNLDKDYTKLRIYLIQHIGGVITSKMLNTIPYNTNGITYHYTGSTGQEEVVPIEEITAKNSYYIKGYDLIQYNNRLVLYNIVGEQNINYQPIVENAEVRYKIFRVAAKDAHKYRNLMGDEVYALGIVPNYIDGTHGPAIHLYGREATDKEMETVEDPQYPNCSECEKKLWELKNTAGRIETYCPEADLYTESANSGKDWEYNPEDFVDPYDDNDELVEELNDSIDEANDIIDDSTSTVDTEQEDAWDAALDCDPCGCGGGPGNLSNAECAALLNACYLSGDDQHPACLLYTVECANPSGGGQLCVDYDYGEDNGGDDPVITCTGNCISDADCPSGCVCQHGICINSSVHPIDNSNFFTTPLSNPYQGCVACGGGSGGNSGGGISSYSGGTSYKQQCRPIPIYDPEGCNIIGYKPLEYAIGKMAYWESKEKYPLTKDCDGNFIYGKNAGRPIRHHKTPDRTIEPHFISYQTGVTNHKQPENHEENETFVHLIGLDICKLSIPEKTTKPLCPHNPFSIVYVPRDSSNKSITAKGLFVDTFKGNVFGENYAIPKYGVNSLEYFNRFIYENGQPGPERAGFKNDDPAYVFHSPDTNILKPGLNNHEAKVELELHGEGFRHGLYEEGIPSESWLIQRVHQRTNRQSIHLNRFSLPAGVTSTFSGDPDGTDPPFMCENIEVSISVECASLGSQNNYTFLGDIVITGIDASVIDTAEINILIDSSSIETITGRLAGVFNGTITSTRPIEFIEVAAVINITTINDCRYSQIVGGTGLCLSKGDTYTIAPVETNPGGGGGPGEGGDIQVEFEGSLLGCIKAESYAPADTIVDKSGKFNSSLLNMYRESSVYLELIEGTPKFTLRNSIDRFITDGMYNGETGEDTTADSTSDGSFMGDSYTHEAKIHNAAGWYGSLKRSLPSQYGRLERLQYIKLGIEMNRNDMLCGRVSGLGGDVFVNAYSVKRTGYISDHVGDTVQRPVDIKNFLRELRGEVSRLKVLRALKFIINAIISILQVFIGDTDAFGVESCGKIPITKDNLDPRNHAGLRYFPNGDSWDGQTPFPGRGQSGPNTGLHNGRRVYYSGLTNTLVTFWTESEVNTYYRETEETGEGNIYRNLKGQVVDSSLRKNAGFGIGWLNKFYIELKEVAPWKKYIVILANILVKIVYPIWAVITIIGIISDIPAPGGFTGAIGIILTILIAVAILAVLLGFFGLFWALLLYLVNHQIYIFLGIDQCRNDSHNKKFGDGNVKGFHDNYHFYNYDHSRINYLTRYYGMGDPFYDCECADKVVSTLIFSNPQVLESPIDAYRNFKINNYIKIPADSGGIQELFIKEGQLYVRTKTNIFNLRGTSSELQLDNAKAVLGSPDFISDPVGLFGGIDEGYGGGTDPNSSINTRFGRIIIDSNAAEIYIFGQNFEPLLIPGNQAFMKKFLNLELLDYYPEFSIVDEKVSYGIGFTMGLDYFSGNLYISKRDYVPHNPEEIEIIGTNRFKHIPSDNIVFLQQSEYFCNKSQSIAINLGDKSLRGVFSAAPLDFMNDGSFLYSNTGDNTIWKHLRRGNFNNFYGLKYPTIIELSFTFPMNYKPKSLLFDTEAVKNINGVMQHMDITFNKILMYNTRETSGVRQLKPLTNENPMSTVEEQTEIPLISTNGLWRIADFNSYTSDINTPLFKKSCNLALTNLVPNEQNIKNDPNGDLLHDKVLNIRLIMDDLQDSNVSIRLKHASLSIERSED